MRQIKTFGIFLLTLMLANTAWSQDVRSNFSDILQTYYISKDKDVVQKTIDFANSPEVNFEDIQPIISGFFGALFHANPDIKNDFRKKLQSFTNNDFRELFAYLIENNGPALYEQTSLSPTQNDMYWASYFATGDTQYLDKIISCASHAANRTDLGLFLTGSSAKWSLCSNAKQNPDIKAYLMTKNVNAPLINEILESDPADLKNETVNIIKDQRKKGVWK